jgi:hypothetical protein
MPDYPIIDPKSLIPLRIIQAELTKNPEYLDHEDCPYPADLKAFLRVFASLVVPVGARKPFLGLHGDKWAILESEANKLYDDLRNFSDEIGRGDVAERMSYFRTATSLLEKIVGINERAVGLKHIHDFQQTVLAVFEEELTADQRTRVTERLKSTIDVEV